MTIMGICFRFCCNVSQTSSDMSYFGTEIPQKAFCLIVLLLRNTDNAIMLTTCLLLNVITEPKNWFPQNSLGMLMELGLSNCHCWFHKQVAAQTVNICRFTVQMQPLSAIYSGTPTFPKLPCKLKKKGQCYFKVTLDFNRYLKAVAIFLLGLCGRPKYSGWVQQNWDFRAQRTYHLPLPYGPNTANSSYTSSVFLLQSSRDVLAVVCSYCHFSVHYK